MDTKNREIKFRAWDKEKKYFNSDYLINIQHKNSDGQVYGCCEGRLLEKEEVDNLIFQQYIGLKDENRKEIYEGDIIEWLRGGEDIMIEEIKIPQVFYEMAEGTWSPTQGKIIGNIESNILNYLNRIIKELEE